MSLTTDEKAEGFKVVATCDGGKTKIGVVESAAVIVEEMKTNMNNQYRLAVDKNTERQIDPSCIQGLR